jgi:hypothetical protein
LIESTVKVVIDQFAQAPILLALIISGLAFMEGRGLDGIKEDMEKQYIYSLIQNCECQTSVQSLGVDLDGSFLSLIAIFSWKLSHEPRETMDPCDSDQHCVCQAGIASPVRQSHLFGVDDISFHDSQ